MIDLIAILKIVVSGAVVWYAGVVFCWYWSRRIERQLRAEPFRPAYNFVPPRRRRNDPPTKEERK